MNDELFSQQMPAHEPCANVTILPSAAAAAADVPPGVNELLSDLQNVLQPLQLSTSETQPTERRQNCQNSPVASKKNGCVQLCLMGMEIFVSQETLPSDTKGPFYLPRCEKNKEGLFVIKTTNPLLVKNIGMAPRWHVIHALAL